MDQKAALTGRPLRVLHLEDSPSDADLVREHLAIGGLFCTVQRVETREEYLSGLAAGDFDVIFADIDLPAFDGFSALALARERCPGVPFFLVTGKEEEAVAAGAASVGVAGCVRKQGLERLVPALSRVLPGRGHREEAGA